MFRRMSTSPEEWEELVAEWRESGMSRKLFAEKHGVPASALSYWIKRLEGTDAAPRRAVPSVGKPLAVRPPATLARVMRPGEASAAERVGEVRIIVGKAMVIVEPGFDDVHLRAVVRALSELG